MIITGIIPANTIIIAAFDASAIFSSEANSNALTDKVLKLTLRKNTDFLIHCWLMRINQLSTRLVFGDQKSLWVKNMMAFIELHL